MTAIPSEWLWGLVGGLMIGCAAALYLLVNGRIMGASGLLGGMLDTGNHHQRIERGAFVAGVIGAPALAAMLTSAPRTQIADNVLLLAIGGLAVGFGTRMANGCTSGHGVCGISRFSVRGFVATLCYLAFGMATMAVLRHGLGWL